MTKAQFVEQAERALEGHDVVWLHRGGEGAAFAALVTYGWLDANLTAVESAEEALSKAPGTERHDHLVPDGS